MSGSTAEIEVGRIGEELFAFWASMGFRNEKSFARAFRFCTGRSPAQYRARA